MASVNKTILVGNLTRDVELRYASSGAAIANITVATNRKWKNRDTGQMEEEAEFHRVVLFNRLAEVAGEYLRTGSSVYIEGRLQTRKWQNKDGQDQYTTEVVAENMQMLGGRSDNDQQGYEGGYTPRTQSGQKTKPASNRNNYQDTKDGRGQQQTPASGTNFDDMSDDIPF